MVIKLKKFSEKQSAEELEKWALHGSDEPKNEASKVALDGFIKRMEHYLADDLKEYIEAGGTKTEFLAAMAKELKDMTEKRGISKINKKSKGFSRSQSMLDTKLKRLDELNEEESEVNDDWSKKRKSGKDDEKAEMDRNHKVRMIEIERNYLNSAIEELKSYIRSTTK